MEVLSRLGVDYDNLATLCRKYHLRRLGIFGSVLTDDFDAESDVDVLVEYDPDHIPDWYGFELLRDLETLFGRKVDLGTYRSIYPSFREQIIPRSVQLYAA